MRLKKREDRSYHAMWARNQADRRRTSGSRVRGIKVVDLSEAPLLSSSFTALRDLIVAALQRAPGGIASRQELLADANGYSLAEIVTALRDLARRGLVRLLWRSPLSFFAFVTEKGKGELHSGSPPAGPVTS